MGDATVTLNCCLVMSRYTENRTDIAIFRKTDTDTDVGFEETENRRIKTDNTEISVFFGFSLAIYMKGHESQFLH